MKMASVETSFCFKLGGICSAYPAHVDYHPINDLSVLRTFDNSLALRAGIGYGSKAKQAENKGAHHASNLPPLDGS